MPVILIVLVPVLLYIPPIQDWAVGYATGKVSRSTGMDIQIERLRLSFPLRLKVDGVNVIHAGGDTMLTARQASLSVGILPLLRGHIAVSGISLDSAFYQLGNSDSIMWLRANIAHGNITATEIILNGNIINLDRADISGARVTLRMLEDTLKAPVDTAASAPWLIRAGLINISDIDYSMSMMPTIDSLGCYVGNATLMLATVDMRSKKIYGKSLRVDSVAAAYIYPRTDSVSTVSPADSTASPPSEMWTITADTLRLTSDYALYAERGAVPSPGFDPSYIMASGISIDIDSFYNRGTDIRVPLRKLTATERCGLQLHADGVFSMGSTAMSAKGFNINTLSSTISFDAKMGIGDLMSDPSLLVSLKGNGLISPSDIVMAFPDMKAMLSPMGLLSFSTDIDGTAGSVDVRELSMSMPDVFRLKGKGTVEAPFDPGKIGGNISLDGSLATLSDRKFSFLPISIVPALQLKADVSYHPGEASGKLAVNTRGGRLAANGSWAARSEKYDARIALDRFPADAFMPSIGIGSVTGLASINGKGYNPMSVRTSVDADVRLSEIEYNHETYRDINLNTSLHAGEASGSLVSHNPGADASIIFDAQLDGDSVHYSINGNLSDINLRTLHLSDSINEGHLDIASAGFYNTRTRGMDIRADVSSLAWQLPGMTIEPKRPISLTSRSEDTGSRTTLDNGDLHLLLTTPGSLFSMISELPHAMEVIQHQADSMRVDVMALNKAIPRFSLQADMEKSNFAAQYLESSGIKVGGVSALLSNDSLISLNTTVTDIVSGSTRIDTIRLNAIQHREYLVYHASMNNRPGTFDDFAHVTLNGFASFNRASVFLKQENIKGKKGFNLGLNADIADSIVTVRLVPLKPTIAYKPWTLNKDNFISLDLTNKHMDADLELAGDNSFIRIFTAHSESHADHPVDSLHRHYTGAQEDLKIQISNMRIQDWLSINPFAPPVKGNLSADLSFRYEKPTLTGDGSVSLSDLYYGRDRVGDFDLDVNVANNPGGKLMADVALMVDSVRTITARGVLNDSTLASPFMLDFNMIRFPLHVVNPFIPNKMATLSGLLNGTMKITGDMAHPIFDGYIDFDTTAVKVTMLGTSFRFSEEKIPVDSNVITFKDFNILGCNSNPLTINGIVDARSLSNMKLDLDMAARNIQIVKSDRARGGADVYGKAFLDLFAGVKGNMQMLNVNADISLLEGTNVTYVIPELEQSVSSQSTQDMVHFVQFNDTTSTQKADSLVSTEMALNLNADLHLKDGATVNVDLSSNGSNRVQVLPSGDLDFTMSPLNGERLTGRVNINGGFVRYTPPLMSEKNFSFQDGSYIAFNGDMMNPVLNVHAVDVVRANVTQDGQNSRVVNFDVMLAVTNTFSNMNVAFDLSTNDDITVQNELSSMSAEQRANQAMNLLLYNVYTGAGTKGTPLSGNPLFSFLTSQLNSWAANNIRGVDISFGIDQYDRTYEGNTSTATSYSYKVSKSLFNDRFKIVVGGNYSTDADNDENFSQNLINDISFEYMLNKSGSMYIKIFRHTGFESILEGEITQTGVGFVLKKKLNTLWELFGIKRD